MKIDHARVIVENKAVPFLMEHRVLCYMLVHSLTTTELANSHTDTRNDVMGLIQRCTNLF